MKTEWDREDSTTFRRVEMTEPMRDGARQTWVFELVVESGHSGHWTEGRYDSVQCLVVDPEGIRHELQRANSLAHGEERCIGHQQLLVFRRDQHNMRVALANNRIMS